MSHLRLVQRSPVKTQTLPEDIKLQLENYVKTLNEAQGIMFNILAECEDKSMFQNYVMEKLDSPIEYMRIVISRKLEKFTANHEETQQQ